MGAQLAGVGGLTVVALLSGGKESFYATMIEYPIDYALFLVYEFPRPNPHLVNLGKSIETMLNAGLRVLVARLRLSLIHI